MQLTYTGPQTAVRISVPGARPVVIERGDSADVPDEIGRDLLEAAPDNWAAAKPAKGKRKPANNDPADEAEEEK